MMHSPSYSERQSLAWLIRARLDKGFTPAEARAFVHRLLVTEVIHSERHLPPDWRLVPMAHDRVMIATADTLEDARYFRFYYAPASKASPPVEKPSRSRKKRDKARAGARRAGKEQAVADARAWFISEDKAGRPLKADISFYWDEAKDKFKGINKSGLKRALNGAREERGLLVRRRSGDQASE